MTLKQIHAMFEVGQTWIATNSHQPKAAGPRVVVQKLSSQLVWKNHLADRFWMRIPKASAIVEAREGFLSFRLFADGSHPDAVVTLTRMEAQ
jgi:hypothetical protein